MHLFKSIEVAWELQDGSGVRVGVSGCVVDEEKQELNVASRRKSGDVSVCATAGRRRRMRIRRWSIAMLPLFLALASASWADTIITDAAHDKLTLIGVTVAQIQAHPNEFHLI
jgi:hypothetical protein